MAVLITTFLTAMLKYSAKTQETGHPSRSAGVSGGKRRHCYPPVGAVGIPARYWRHHIWADVQHLVKMGISCSSAFFSLSAFSSSSLHGWYQKRPHILQFPEALDRKSETQPSSPWRTRGILLPEQSRQVRLPSGQHLSGWKPPNPRMLWRCALVSVYNS